MTPDQARLLSANPNNLYRYNRIAARNLGIRRRSIDPRFLTAAVIALVIAVALLTVPFALLNN